MSRLCPVYRCNLVQFNTDGNGHIFNFIIYFQGDVQTSVDSYGQQSSPFHGENRGSIPLGRASDFNRLAGRAPKYVKYPSNKYSVVISGLSCSAVDTLGSRGFIEPLIDVGKSYDNASWIYDPCR